MFELLNLLFLFLTTSFLISFIKSKKTRIVIAVLLSFFLILQIASFYSSYSLIDSKFIQNFTLNEIAIGYTWFFKEIIAGIILISLFTYLSVKLSYFLDKIKLNYRIIISILLLIPFLLPNGIIHNFYTIFKLNQNITGNLDDSLKLLGLNSADSIQVTSENRNIIILSLESFEAGYLDSPLNKLTPNLSQLKKEWNFYELTQVPTGNYTFGSLYTLVTGLPITGYGLGTGDIPNEWAKDFNNKTKLPNLIKILNNAQYNTSFYIVDGDYAGTKDFLTSCGNVNLIDNKYIKSGSSQDLDLFEEMKVQIKNSQAKNEKFAMILSSLNTHFPHGIYDARMEAKVGKEDEPMHVMVKSTDYLIGDLIKYLKANNLMDKTDIYIFPDHYKMGADREVLNNLPPRLFFLTNVKDSFLPVKSGKTINQIDEIKMILNGSKIKHTTKFLSEVTTGDELLKNWDNDIFKYNAVNKLAFVRDNSVGNAIDINIEGDKMDIQTNQQLLASIPKNLNLENKIVVTFDITGKMLEVFQTKRTDSTLYEYQMNIYKSIIGYTVELVSECSYYSDWFYSNSKIEPQELAKFFNCNNTISPEKLAKISNDVSRYIAYGGGSIDFNNRTNSLEALNLSYKNGFRLLGLDFIKSSDSIYIASNDFPQWKQLNNFADSIPIPDSIFMKSKILKKYTPMDIKTINKWFIKHNDAILIASNVYKPVEFAKQFTDLKRLRMEVNTLDAFYEALANNIQPIVTESVLDNFIKDNSIDMLYKFGVKYISVKSENVLKYKYVINYLNGFGIKTYLNTQSNIARKPESYVVSNQLHIAYGLFVNNWTFTTPEWNFKPEIVKSNELAQRINFLKKAKFKEYINQLQNMKYYIVMVAKDEVSRYMKNQLRPIGSEVNWKDKLRWSYIGLFNPHLKYKNEYLSKSKLDISISNPLKLKIQSFGFDLGNVGQIEFENSIYTCSRGLVVLVYDPSNKFIIDNCFFDTYGDENPIRNKLY